MIFNNGKYKSLLASEQGELAQIRQVVEMDQHFRPNYHLAPPTGLLNDPNGLIFDGEKYHIFYQWFPFDALHGMKHWQHFTTEDFIHYQQADLLIPDEIFESHGCYSGGAILWQDQIIAFYTGNTRRASDNQRIPHQNIAIFDKSGKLLGKHCLMDAAPEGYTEHCRDPKPFVTPEGKIRFVLGAQRENLSGTALLFELDQLTSKPHLLGELAIKGFDNQHVFMWECPDLFTLNDKDLFIWSPQGKQRERYQFQNNYHATYAIGKLTDCQFDASHIAELDQGFDFYAPQTFANSQRTILFGWCGLPDLTYPTDQYKWHSMLSMPRQLSLKNGKLYQQPIDEIYQHLSPLQSIEIAAKKEIAHLDQAYLKFKPQQQAFNIEFFSNEKGQRLMLSYNGEQLCLDRTATEQTPLMQQFGEQRYCEIKDLQQVEIFFDHSIVEIYLNQGEKVMTSRFFISERKNSLKTDRSFVFEIAYPSPICYQS